MCVFGIYTNEQKDPGFKTTLCVISELKKRGLTYYLDEQIADKTAPELSVKGKKNSLSARFRRGRYHVKCGEKICRDGSVYFRL